MCIATALYNSLRPRPPTVPLPSLTSIATSLEVITNSSSSHPSEFYMSQSCNFHYRIQRNIKSHLQVLFGKVWPTSAHSPEYQREGGRKEERDGGSKGGRRLKIHCWGSMSFCKARKLSVVYNNLQNGLCKINFTEEWRVACCWEKKKPCFGSLSPNFTQAHPSISSWNKKEVT